MNILSVRLLARLQKVLMYIKKKNNFQLLFKIEFWLKKCVERFRDFSFSCSFFSFQFSIYIYYFNFKELCYLWMLSSLFNTRFKCLNCQITSVMVNLPIDRHDQSYVEKLQEERMQNFHKSWKLQTSQIYARFWAKCIKYLFDSFLRF